MVKKLILFSLLFLSTFYPSDCQSRSQTQAIYSAQDYTEVILLWMNRSKTKPPAPIVGNLQMPEPLWSLVLVASDVLKLNPSVLASVARFESDFRCGPVGGGEWVGPMNVQKDFAKKYPIYQIIGNLLTGGRALGGDLSASLRNYNRDRSYKFALYCKAVINEEKKLRGQYKNLHRDWAWDVAVVFGKLALVELENQKRSWKIAKRLH